MRAWTGDRAKSLVFAGSELKLARQEERRMQRNITEFKSKCRELIQKNAGVIDSGDFRYLVETVLKRQPKQDVRQERLQKALKLLRQEQEEVEQERRRRPRYVRGLCSALLHFALLCSHGDMASMCASCCVPAPLWGAGTVVVATAPRHNPRKAPWQARWRWKIGDAAAAHAQVGRSQLVRSRTRLDPSRHANRGAAPSLGCLCCRMVRSQVAVLERYARALQGWQPVVAPRHVCQA